MIDDNKKKIKELEKALEKEKKAHEKTKKEFEQYKAKYPVEKKELPDFVKENIKTEKKIPGQKKGHKGYFRKYPERIDLIKPLEINFCPDCDGQLSETQEVRKRIIIDIPLRELCKISSYITNLNH